jgi:hypothetical protein
VWQWAKKRRRRNIASPFENTQGRLRSFDFARDDGKRKRKKEGGKRSGFFASL